MPIYEYACGCCGVFSRLVKLSDSALPALCPECGAESPRVISAPALSIMATANRTRWDRNERAKHEPHRVRRSACGCSGTHNCGTGNKTANEKDNTAAGATKLQRQIRKNARPWMLGH